MNVRRALGAGAVHIRRQREMMVVDPGGNKLRVSTVVAEWRLLG